MGTQNERHGKAGDLALAETRRLLTQTEIDSGKTLEERRRLGQYATPYPLAREIVSYGLTLLEADEVSFLEPALGSGVFFSALLGELLKSEKGLKQALGVEIDHRFSALSSEIWGNKLKVVQSDFTELASSFKANFLVTNPPYIRHHLISEDKKQLLHEQVLSETGINISGLAGFYCYYLLLAHKWLALGAISAWLVPSEFMDVNYGGAVKTYLLDKVKLLRIHRYEPTEKQFSDALVSSCVVWFKNEPVSGDYEVEFTYGGTHTNPASRMIVSRRELSGERKWTHFSETAHVVYKENAPTLGDFFDIKRGVATGDNAFFILSDQQIEENQLDRNFFIPILPSPRFLKVNEVLADTDGSPQIEPKRFLLNCTLSEHELEMNYPNMWKYLIAGKNNTGSKYLCKSRKIWYLQEQRTSAPFLCSYMGRGDTKDNAPFRFIFNHSDAIATNSYLMLYPKDFVAKALSQDHDLAQEIWLALKNITSRDLTWESRVYGGGLKKIEPKELSRVKCVQLGAVIREAIHPQPGLLSQ